MTRRLRPRSWLPILSLALLAGTADAHEERWVLPGDFYGSVAGGVDYVNLPEVTAYFSPDPGDAFSGTDDEILRWTTEAVLGYADPDGLSLPDPIGRNARVELRVRYGEGKSDRRDVPTGDLGFVAPAGAGGTFTAGIGAGPTALTNTSLQTWDVDLTYETDVILGDVVSLTPLIGITYTRLDLANDFKIPVPLVPPFPPLELNDEITAHYYGVALGGELGVRPLEWLRLSLGVRADLMGASANLDVDADPSSMSTAFGEETDNDSNFAARGTTTVGVEATLGRVTLGLEGHARYLSYLPVADHPVAIAPADRGSNIDGESMWAVGGMARLTVWWP